MRQKTADRRRKTRAVSPSGSAIILAIVLTTLLAIVGVLFLLSSRVDSVATSAVGDNQDLKLAVDTVVAQISQKLVLDTPGVDANGTYYDYPDPCSDFWLACLEPYQYAPNNYRWRHITDLYNNFGLSADNIIADIIPEYQPSVAFGDFADADGDGVSDSAWIEIPGKASSKGKPIYAAIRIIDNGGMLNINTAYKFDPNYSVGSTQSDINLMAFAARDHTHTQPPQLIDTRQDRLLSYRCGSESNNTGLYEQRVVWQYGLPLSAYTPFDISDELVLRNRYILNNDQMETRIENLWTYAFKGGLEDPRTDVTKFQTDPDYWFARTNNVSADPCVYDYQHLATTYNLDRIITPNGQKMFNINSPLTFDVNSIYDAVHKALDPNVFSSIDVALITANLMDYIDGPDYPPTGDPRYDPNNNVTVVYDDVNTPHYGFERPCVYISEIAQNFYQPDPNDPNVVYRSYAIELFKPYWEDDEPNGWKLIIQNNLDNSIYSDSNIIWTGSRRFHVLANIDPIEPNANILIDFNDIPGPNDFNGFEPNLPQATDVNFVNNNSTIYLLRNINGSWIPVDWIVVPEADAYGNGWLEPTTIAHSAHSYERDIDSIHRCIRKVWSPTMTTSPTIGYMNLFPGWGDMIQAHPANKPFTNVGEIGQLFRTDAYVTEPNDTEFSVRLNLADPNVQSIFKYLTVIDPCDHSPINPNETRIKGRININTAPWFVLAQLPWVSYHTPNYDLARSIVNYRDTIHGPFKNIGELMTDANSSINSIGYYEGEFVPIPAGLLTPPDGVGDKFEERDVIFDRISNLITVRSDVFTAYILVRIGKDGPQKRVIAIFDRSGVTPAGGKVKIVAIQPVPDPR